jgi:ABC-type branched-subunit amino acid transport system substrate-binding protein
MTLCAVSVGVAILAMTACSSPAQPARQSASVTLPARSPQPFVEDNILTIGLLLPQSGPGSIVGSSIRRAVETAKKQINGKLGGGVMGHDIEILERNESDVAATALDSATELLDLKVDLIIGPASSNIALSVLPKIISSGTAVCLPAATAIALDSFPDDDLMVRTMPSDALEAEAMASQIEATGQNRVSIAYIDDSYGRAYATALEEALVRHKLALKQSLPYSPDGTDFENKAALILDGASSIALIGDAIVGHRLLNAIVSGKEAAELPNIFVNDTLRQPPSSDSLFNMSAEVRNKIHGVSPTFTTPPGSFLTELNRTDSELASTLFAAQAYDCVNLAALSAVLQKSTNGLTLFSDAFELTSGGSPCKSFLECKPLVEINFDYNGADETLTIGASGDRLSALYETFGFDASGHHVSAGDPFVVSIPG